MELNLTDLLDALRREFDDQKQSIERTYLDDKKVLALSTLKDAMLTVAKQVAWCTQTMTPAQVGRYIGVEVG